MRIYENPDYGRFVDHEYVDMVPNGSEPLYRPNLWNSDAVIEKNNCYTYALGIIFQDASVSPGQMSSPVYSRIGANPDLMDRYYTKNGFLNMVRHDSMPGVFSWNQHILDATQFTGVSLDYGFIFDGIEKEKNVVIGSYRVALAFDLESKIKDYHWYRQGPDGFWSGKNGWMGPATDFDFDGNPICDPSYCNRHLGDSVDKMKNMDISSHFYSDKAYFFTVKWNTEEVVYEEDYLDIDF